MSRSAPSPSAPFAPELKAPCFRNTPKAGRNKAEQAA